MKAVKKIETHILSSSAFSSEIRAVYEILWNKYSTAGQTIDDNTIRRMRLARQITTSRIQTHTHTHTLRTFVTEYC